MAGAPCEKCGEHGGLWPLEINTTLCRRCRIEWNACKEREYILNILRAWLGKPPTTQATPTKEVASDE